MIWTWPNTQLRAFIRMMILQNNRYDQVANTLGVIMEWTKSGEDLLVRIDPGEEIHSSLQKLADEVGFNAAAITLSLIHI